MGFKAATACARKAAYEADRQGYVQRGRTERKHRRVGIRPAPDTMSIFSGYLPVEQGVAELHTSFVRTSDARYTVRGLSQQPTLVKRPLERIDIRYDPARPAPLETELRSEDVVILSDGRNEAQVEFVMLPKEER